MLIRLRPGHRIGEDGGDVRFGIRLPGGVMGAHVEVER